MIKAPGWQNCTNDSDLNRMIAEHCRSCVPENGVVLELGSLFGATTQLAHANIPASARIFTIDWWRPIPMRDLIKLQEISPAEYYDIMQEILDACTFMYNNEPYLPEDVFYNYWLKFTSHINNLTHIRSRVTDVPQDTVPMVDLILQDCQHSYEGVLSELEHWWPNLKPGGVLIFDDFCKFRWPGAYQACKEFFARTPYDTFIHTTSNNLVVRNSR